MLSWRVGLGGKREGLPRLRGVNAAQGAHAGRTCFVPSLNRKQLVPMCSTQETAGSHVHPQPWDEEDHIWI